ncbi:uncharacterized protein LOC127907463 isoform X2 [Oncorhynchus keta]|uniref:uncharacterized protein LOC127907463 isoform X2 n=1 Tax=Oncorhynchus keta TaxID=8018 RepID=UPI00227A2F33|nr:uncharacterized protein LOC127907463 isoform X2 [Oncorhynchus keta]
MEPNPAALSPHTKHNTQVKISKQTLICLRGNSRSCSGWRLARQMVTYLMSPGQVPTSPPDRHSRLVVPGPLTDAVPHNTPPPPWTSRGDRRTLSDPYWTPDVVGPPPVSGGLGGVWPRGVLGSSGRHSGFQHHW